MVHRHGAIYPVAEDYHFKPLDEHVKVYQHRFRIVQDIAIDASSDHSVDVDRYGSRIGS